MATKYISVALIALSILKAWRRGKSWILGNLCLRIMQLAGIQVGRKLRVRGWCYFWRNPGATIIVGDGVRLSAGVAENPICGGAKTVLVASAPNARLEIGEGTGISGSVIYARESVLIGKRVNIGAGCTIIDNDFHSSDVAERDSVNVPTAPIIIENDAWLGANVTVLKGVRIGKGAIIGAGAVVTSSIPSGVIAAGVPAKIIRPAN